MKEIKIGPIEHPRGKYYISNVPPVVYEEAKMRYPKIDFYGKVVHTLFTYGDTIHTFNGVVNDDVLEHELTHIEQQRNYPGGAAAWWRKYFDNKDFRFSQELEAYRVQYDYIVSVITDRNKRFLYLLQLGKTLKNIYGLDKTTEEMMNLIKG